MCVSHCCLSKEGKTWRCLFSVHNIYTPCIQTCSHHRGQGIKLKGALQHIWQGIWGRVWCVTPLERKLEKLGLPLGKKEMPHLVCQRVGKEMPSTCQLKKKTRIFKSMNVASRWTGKAECSGKWLRRKARVLLLPEKFIRVFRMWKLDMTHSWEGGQGCLYPNLLCQQEV